MDAEQEVASPLGMIEKLGAMVVLWSTLDGSVHLSSSVILPFQSAILQIPSTLELEEMLHVVGGGRLAREECEVGEMVGNGFGEEREVTTP